MRSLFLKNSHVFICLLIIVSCGGGGGGGGNPAPPTPPLVAPTVNLSANPVSVELNNAATLSWSSTNATTCSALWTSSTETSGSEDVIISAAGNNTFNITCTGTGGSRSAAADRDPPVPVQVMLKVLLPAAEIITSSDPEVSVEEVHKAEHVVALVDDQLNVAALFNSTETGFAERFTVGATNGGVGGAGLPPPPPPPPQETMIKRHIKT